MADRIGNYKVSRREFKKHQEYTQLVREGGNIGGDVSIEGDVDVLNTISASAGSFNVPGDLLFQCQNGDTTTDILSTTGVGLNLGIHNNLIYSNGTSLGIGTVEPRGKLEVKGNVLLTDLPTTVPTLTGSLWISGSTTAGSSQFVVVFTGK